MNWLSMESKVAFKILQVCSSLNSKCVCGSELAKEPLHITYEADKSYKLCAETADSTNRLMITEPLHFNQFIYVWNTYAALSRFD